MLHVTAYTALAEHMYSLHICAFISTQYNGVLRYLELIEQSYKNWMAPNSIFLCWCAIKKLLTHSIEHGHDRRAIVLIVIIAHFSNQYVFKYCICIFSTDCCYIVTCCYCICFKHLLYCIIRHVCYISKMHNFLWCSTFTPLLPSIQGASKNNPVCKQWFLNNVVNILMHFFVIYSQWRRHSRCVGCEKNTEYFCTFFLVIYA